MIPIDQTTFGFPSPTNPGGNCFTACVASLLELTIDEVPFFAGHEDRWWDVFVEWLDERGFWPLCYRLTADTPRPSGFYILGGQSPRKPDDPSALHAVVAHGDKIVHDPHPSRAGLLSRFDAIVLVPMDPARAI